jgi:AraC-like DNA-binding protein
MDAVTDVFQSMQIAGVIQARLEATAPWGLKREVNAKDGDGRHAGARSPSPFAHFGMVTGGKCWVSADGLPDAIPLSDGDCFLSAPGRPYTVQDNPHTGAQSFCSVATENESQVIKYGGGGAPTTIIYGWFRFCAISLRPLARLLPPLILVKADEPQTLAMRTTMTMLASEMAKPAPGSELVVQSLADILFVQCLRTYIESRSGACNTALLRAFFDPHIGVALKFMHEQLGAAWTVKTMATACGMSRSAFALRFKGLVGETPLEYLTAWRMRKAAVLLQKGDKKLIDVARSVGYDSEAAFSTAFKRVVHVAPREFRRGFLASRATSDRQVTSESSCFGTGSRNA